MLLLIYCMAGLIVHYVLMQNSLCVQSYDRILTNLTLAYLEKCTKPEAARTSCPPRNRVRGGRSATAHIVYRGEMRRTVVQNWVLCCMYHQKSGARENAIPFVSNLRNRCIYAVLTVGLSLNQRLLILNRRLTTWAMQHSPSFM